MTLQATDVRTFEKKWDTIRRDIQRRWPQLDQSDLKMIDGDSRKLIALVHQKTGAGLSQIEEAIDEIAAGSGGLLARVVKTATQKTAAVSEQVKQSAADVYRTIDDTVSSHPSRSLGLAFGAGIAIGFLLSCCRRSNANDSRRSDFRHWVRGR